MGKLVKIFCYIDDFYQIFIPTREQHCIDHGHPKRRRPYRMSVSEIVTIVIAFHGSNHRDFKNFYLGLISRHHKKEFPTLLSYTRFLGVVQSVLVPLCSYFSQVKGTLSDIEFIDSTSIKVCHNIHIPRYNVFDDITKRSKGTTISIGCAVVAVKL